MLEKTEENVLGRIISRYPIIFSVLVAILLASAVYAVNNYFFYRSREFDKNSEAKIVFQGVQSITKAGMDNNEIQKMSIESFISDIRASVTVIKSHNDVQMWQTWNGKQQDTSRQMIKNEMQFEADNSRYVIIYEYGNMPDMLLSIWRAFSFSIYDYVENSDKYWQYRLLNRSLPFWSYFIIIFLAIVGAVKKYKQDLQVIPLLQAQYQDKIALVIENSNEQLERERSEREEIEKEIKEKEKELENLSNASEEEKQKNSELISKLQAEKVDLSEQKEMKDKTIYDLEFEKMMLEDEMSKKDKTINELVEKTQKLQEQIQNTAKMEQGYERDISFKNIKKIIRTEYLSKNYKSAKVSEHCRSHEFEPLIAKLIDEELFVEVRNAEYDARMRGTIKIIDEKTVGNDGAAGSLKIILREDKGRSVLCRFAVKKELGGHIEKIGFVIAMLIRAKYKEFNDFTIKIAG